LNVLNPGKYRSPDLQYIKRFFLKGYHGTDFGAGIESAEFFNQGAGIDAFFL